MTRTMITNCEGNEMFLIPSAVRPGADLSAVPHQPHQDVQESSCSFPPPSTIQLMVWMPQNEDPKSGGEWRYCLLANVIDHHFASAG